MDEKIGCLIIHGFSGSIREIEPLNKYLSGYKIATACPSLKGHTGNRSDLAWVSYREWINSAEKELLKLSDNCKKIILIGYSMGGLIAFNLALYHKISAIVTLSTPIYTWDKRRIAMNIIDDFKKKSYKNLRHYKNALLRTPFSAMLNFEMFLHNTKPIIKQITYPVFIAQGLLDDTVQHRSANYIYKNIASSQKKLKYYNNSDHIICHSPDKDEVFNDVLSFIRDSTIYN